MQAIQLLKQEHGEAQVAFREIEQASIARRGALWTNLRLELDLHEKKEAEHLYGPAARENQADRTLADWEGTHLHEVQEAERLIKEIGRLDPSDDAWLGTVKKLRGALERHIQKEEQHIWPTIERLWSRERLEEAGRRMEAITPTGAAAA